MKSVTIALIAGGVFSSSVFAQLEGAQIGRSGSFGNITNVGRFSGSRTLSGNQQSIARTPGGGTSANQVNTSSARGVFSGRRSDTSVRGFGTTVMNSNARAGSLIMYLGRSPSARFFGHPVYDGRGSLLQRRIPTFDNDSTRSILKPQQQLPITRSFHHRAILPRAGGAIRDELTNTSLQNTAPLPEDISYDNAMGEAHAKMLARSINAKYEHYVSEGWKLLASKDLRAEKYMRGRIYFENAMTIEPDKLEARIGKMLCSLVGGQYATAGAELSAAMERDDQILSVDVRSADIFADPKTTRDVLVKLTRRVQQEPDTAFLAALQAYVLWFDGQKVAAATAATKLRENFRTTPYTSLADQILNGPKKRDAVLEAASIGG